MKAAKVTAISSNLAFPTATAADLGGLAAVASRFRPNGQQFRHTDSVHQQQKPSVSIPKISPEFVRSAMRKSGTLSTTSSASISIGLVVKQEWEGCIRRIVGDYIEAELVDVRNSSAPYTIASIPTREFALRDRKRLRVGLIFRWAIGTSIKNRTQKKVSFIAIRDIPSYSKREIDSAETEGRQLADALSALIDDSPTY